MRVAADNALRKADPGRKPSWSGMPGPEDIGRSYRFQDMDRTDTRRLVAVMPIIVLCIGERTWRCDRLAGKGARSKPAWMTQSSQPPVWAWWLPPCLDKNYFRATPASDDPNPC